MGAGCPSLVGGGVGWGGLPVTSEGWCGVGADCPSLVRGGVWWKRVWGGGGLSVTGVVLIHGEC